MIIPDNDNTDQPLDISQIYETYKELMYNTALSITKNETTAEDIVHDVFLKVLSRHKNFIINLTPKKRLQHYLLIATRNAAINYIRQKRHNDLPLDNCDNYSTEHSISDDDFIDTICTNLTYQDIVHIIRSMKANYRDPIYLHFVLEFSIPDTAKVLGRSVPTVQKQLVRGKKIILSKLDKKGD